MRSCGRENAKTQNKKNTQKRKQSKRKKREKRAKNDKGENYYVIETREVDRNLFDVIAKFYEIIYMCCLLFFQRKKTP